MAPLVLMLLGKALSPLLKVKLLPDRALPSVTVYYNYNGANAVVADSIAFYRDKTIDNPVKT